MKIVDNKNQIIGGQVVSGKPYAKMPKIVSNLAYSKIIFINYRLLAVLVLKNQLVSVLLSSIFGPIMQLICNSLIVPLLLKQLLLSNSWIEVSPAREKPCIQSMDLGRQWDQLHLPDLNVGQSPLQPVICKCKEEKCSNFSMFIM